MSKFSLLLTPDLFEKILQAIDEGLITALSNEAEIVAALEKLGVPITPQEAAAVAAIATALLAVLQPPKPAEVKGPLTSPATILGRGALIHADTFGGAKDGPLQMNLRAVRNWHAVHQFVADAGGTEAIVAACGHNDPQTLTDATSAAVSGGYVGTPNWTNIIAVIEAIMEAIATMKPPTK